MNWDAIIWKERPYVSGQSISLSLLHEIPSILHDLKESFEKKKLSIPEQQDIWYP